MNLYVVRHADALAAGIDGVMTDEERPLTEEGQRQVKGLAGAFQRLAVVPERIVTSPLVRARQTAEGLARRLGLPPEAVIECKALAPDGSSKKLGKFLRKLAARAVVVVGHEPDLGRHTAWLLGGKKARIGYAKSAAAHLVCDREPDKGAGSLRWLITPPMFGVNTETT